MRRRTRADLQKTILDVRNCEAQLAARRGRLDAMRTCGHETGDMERAVVVKAVELELLKVIEGEIAEALSSSWQSLAVMDRSPRHQLH